MKPDGKDYRIQEIDCEDDLTEAIRLYAKAKQAGKKMATLRCRNSGFPPPEEYRPQYKTVRRGKTKTRIYVRPIRKLNRKGIYWCPYCREFRKFQRQGGFRILGVRVSVPGLHCPLCGTSHRDFHVRIWNPEAKKQYNAETAGVRRSKRA